MVGRWLSVAALALTAACGGAAVPSEHIQDPNAVASRFGCTGTEPIQDGPELFMAREIDCTYRGQFTTVGVFATGQAQANWNKAALTVGGGDGTTVVGSGYVVEANDSVAAQAIAAALGAKTE